jgi:hypothetical protein
MERAEYDGRYVMATAAALAKALPELIVAEERLRKLAAAEGIVYRIADFGGVRTEADTVKILKYRADDYAAAQKAGDKNALAKAITDWRPIAPFGSSFHNYGAAFDVRPTQWPATLAPLAVMEKLRSLAPKAGLRVLNTKDDPWHFELNTTLDEARRRWSNHAGKSLAVGGPGGSTFVVVGIVGLLIAAVLYFRNQPKKGKRA